MSLDIEITQRKPVIYPQCGEIVAYTHVDTIDSGGRAWYPFLESIGYYVPYDQRTEENNWYGKDMMLTGDQAKELCLFLQKKDVYRGEEVEAMVDTAMAENNTIVVNADW
jgi:hypothetical protein